MSLADPLIPTTDPDLGAHRRHGRSLDILTQIVGLAGDLAPTLKAALGRLPSRFTGEMVFTSPDGQLIDPDNFSHRDWARVLRRSTLRRIRFHDLRHTYSSLLIAQGAHPKCIQAQLGHASIQTTLDRCGHLMPDMHAIEARKLDRLVFGTERTTGGSDAVSSGDRTGGEPRT